LLPSHAGDPSMSGGEVWNDVSCKLPQLSGPDPVSESVLNFTNLLTEGAFEDWLEDFKVNKQTYPKDYTLVSMTSSTSEMLSESSYYFHHFNV
jgi:hypothetical protein